MASRQQRAFALIIAVLFLATSVATGAMVIWQMQQDDNQASVLQDLNEGSQEGMLKGTTLDNFEPVSDVTELQIIDLEEGDGEVVAEGANVTAHYTGAFATNGLIFESSKDSGQPVDFSLGGVIAGWQEGVPGMKVGGKRRLIIPGSMAYGEAPEGYTPNLNSQPMGPLVFDIELVELEQ